MNNWNQATTLYNKKPTTKEYYQYPASTLLYALQTLSHPALRLWLVLSGQADGFTGSMKIYCDRANISPKHYKRYRTELVDNNFLLYEPYKSITVLYPLSPHRE
jgi:hypothetical protein